MLMTICFFHVSSLKPFVCLYLVKFHILSFLKGEQRKNSRDTPHQSHDLHVSAMKQYATVEPLPLPENVEEINAAEMTCFSPQRARDISGSVILSKTIGSFLNGCARNYNQQSYPLDLHVASYDCRGTVSMSSVMQTMVPEPFSKEGHATYLNMPGGQWGQGYKYISRDMHNTHYQNLIEKSASKDGGDDPGTLHTTGLSAEPYCLFNCLQAIPLTFMKGLPLQTRGHHMSFLQRRPLLVQTTFMFSTNTDNSKLTRTDKLKRAVKEYGITVVIFHIGISLLSLGGFYVAVTRYVLHRFEFLMARCLSERISSCKNANR